MYKKFRKMLLGLKHGSKWAEKLDREAAQFGQQ